MYMYIFIHIILILLTMILLCYFFKVEVNIRNICASSPAFRFESLRRLCFPCYFNHDNNTQYRCKHFNAETNISGILAQGCIIC